MGVLGMSKERISWDILGRDAGDGVAQGREDGVEGSKRRDEMKEREEKGTETK